MGFMGNVKDFFEPVTKRAKPPDPAAQLLAQLQASANSQPSSSQLYSDALNQVGGAYQAGIANLGQDEANAKKRQQQGDAQLKAMYGALGKDIGKNAGNIKGYYNEGAANNKAYTSDALKGINSAYSQSRNELGALFSQLGIEAAAPDAMGGAAEDQGFLSGLANLAGQRSGNSLNQDKATALAFNTQQQNIAGLTGNEKRSGLMSQLNDALMNIGQQRNQLYGQMGDAVSQRQYQLEQDAMSRSDQLNQMMFSLSEAQSGGAAGAKGPSASQQYSMMGPSEKGFYKASETFGPDQAGYVMQLLNGVSQNQNEGYYPNSAKFIRSVLAENEKQSLAGQTLLDPETLQAIASYYFDVGGVSNKAVPN